MRLNIFYLSGECRRYPLLELCIGKLEERSSGKRQNVFRASSPHVVKEFLFLIIDLFQPLFPSLFCFAPCSFLEQTARALRYFSCTSENVLSILVESFALRPIFRRLAFRRVLALGRLAQARRNALLTVVHGSNDRPVEVPVQQPDQHQEVDDLRRNGDPVYLHELSCGHGQHPIPDRIGEDEDH